MAAGKVKCEREKQSKDKYCNGLLWPTGSLA